MLNYTGCPKMNITESQIALLVIGTLNWFCQGHKHWMYEFEFLSQNVTGILYSSTPGKFSPVITNSLLLTRWSTSFTMLDRS